MQRLRKSSIFASFLFSGFGKDIINPKDNYFKTVFFSLFEKRPERKTFEWDILNPDRIINLEIKKKSGLSI